MMPARLPYPWKIVVAAAVIAVVVVALNLKLLADVALGRLGSH